MCPAGEAQCTSRSAGRATARARTSSHDIIPLDRAHTGRRDLTGVARAILSTEEQQQDKRPPRPPREIKHTAVQSLRDHAVLTQVLLASWLVEAAIAIQRDRRGALEDTPRRGRLRTGDVREIGRMSAGSTWSTHARSHCSSRLGSRPLVLVVAHRTSKGLGLRRLVRHGMGHRRTGSCPSWASGARSRSRTTCGTRSTPRRRTTAWATARPPSWWRAGGAHGSQCSSRRSSFVPGENRSATSTRPLWERCSASGERGFVHVRGTLAILVVRAVARAQRIEHDAAGRLNHRRF